MDSWLMKLVMSYNNSFTIIIVTLKTKIPHDILESITPMSYKIVWL